MRIGTHLVIDCSAKSCVWRACVITFLFAYVIASLMCLYVCLLVCLSARMIGVLTCSGACVLKCFRIWLVPVLSMFTYSYVSHACCSQILYAITCLRPFFLRLPYLLYISKVKFRKILPKKICLYFLISLCNQFKRSSQVNNNKICKIMISR